jgi:ComF family protein
MPVFWRGLEAIAGSVVAVAFPARCILCRIDLEWPHRGPLCEECLRSLPSVPNLGCPRCGLSYAAGVAGGLCGPCRNRRRRRFRKARAAGPYEDGLKECLLQLKFGGRERLASTLGRLAFERSIGCGQLAVPDAVVPIPLHRRRRRERGYNQAELLAQTVARLAGVPLRKGILVKTKDRPPQAELSAESRWRNAAGAYGAHIPLSLRGKDLLLVDDVFTTGATVEACTRALLRSGAGAVDVLTVARVV